MSDCELMNEFARDGALPAGLKEFAPEVGLVLGSGLGSFVERIEVERVVPYAEIEDLPVSRVAGHAGEFTLGRIGDCRILVARGRVHLYEGYDAKEVCAGVRVMAAAGIERLILTNAAGSLNPAFAPGDWMQITDQLNLTGRTPLLGGPHFHDMTEVYSARLREGFRAVAAELGMALHEGVYASVLGPQYETPAEVRMLGKLGADAVGMSTVLEAIQARALGLEVAGFSCLTNFGAGLGGGGELSHAEVVETGEKAAGQLVELLAAGL